MSDRVYLTTKELADAHAWVAAHVQEKHPEGLEYAVVAIRTGLGNSGIGGRTVVTCEACEQVKVDNKNSFDVTDYDAW